jgi:hypothetical protein
MHIEKHTIGMGDRFAHQGKAQLLAVQKAWELGLAVHPVWNKSNREHLLVGSRPDELRAEADAAASALGWERPYYVDADHIGLKTVEGFLAASDFFTIDVADFTGKPADTKSLEAFCKKMEKHIGTLELPVVGRSVEITPDAVASAAQKFLLAIEEAARIYRRIAEFKGAVKFVTEVSVDETDTPQTPVELYLILAMIAGEEIPVQTIAPKFTGRFNKGVDYVGDLERFEKEFDEDLAILQLAVRNFGLPSSLKLSVHSGSDKFSLYPIINRLLKKHDAGLHVKTAGTTWLEEVIGLAESGGDGLQIAKTIYSEALSHFDELTAPYATVIDICRDRLPSTAEVESWSAVKFAGTLRHDQSNPDYNSDFRQLIHVAFKLAAKMGARFTNALLANEDIIARNVTANILQRHIKPIFA